jgi:polyferredoxin
MRIVPPVQASAVPAGDALQRVGDWLQRHQSAIRSTQWSIVAVYLVLLVVPIFLPLPGRTDCLWTSFTRFAQFVFWGIWWPGVVLSTALVGRMWCGLLCPEGTITEFASGHGRGHALPRWIRWPGWPTVAFASTTLYGQMISVYQYPRPALLILGGSTLAAASIGYLYGSNKRVWCRYLCPVSGVFALLAKIAPLHFRVDPVAWRRSQLSGIKPAPVNCAPMVALRTMRGGSGCHMCGRCSGFRGAIRLARRSPDHEIVHVAGETPKPWETILIVFGLMGIAVGAFQWSASPWLVAAKQMAAEQLVDAGIVWPLDRSAPWWVLTNYPERNDVMTLLDGGLLAIYVLAAALVLGTAVTSMLALAVRCLGSWRPARFHHLAQTFIPLAGAGVFLGLLSLTVSQLRADGIALPFVGTLRALLLLAASVWSATLFWQVTGLYSGHKYRRIFAVCSACVAMAIVDSGWFLLFWAW